jgi:predicted nucleic-acid-binding protein
LVGADTNVLVRVLIGDDPAQTALAERFFLRHAEGDGVYVSMVVLAEVAWVLRAGFKLDRVAVHERLERLVTTRGVFLDEPALVLAALDRCADGHNDLADMLIAGRSWDAGARPLYSFDVRLAGADERVVLLSAESA